MMLQHIFRRAPRLLSLCAPLMPVPVYAECHGFRMPLDLREYIQRSIYLGRYEPTQSGWVRSILKPGGTFLDIGANVI